MASVSPANPQQSTIRKDPASDVPEAEIEETLKKDLVFNLSTAPVLRPGQTALGSSEEQIGLDFEGGIKTAQVADENLDDSRRYLEQTFPGRGVGAIDFAEGQDLPEGIDPDATVVLEGIRRQPLFAPDEPLPDDSPYAGFTPNQVQNITQSQPYQANLNAMAEPQMQKRAQAQGQLQSVQASRGAMRRQERAARKAVRSAESAVRDAKRNAASGPFTIVNGEKVHDNPEVRAHLARAEAQLNKANNNLINYTANEEAQRRQLNAATIAPRQAIASSNKILENAEEMAFRKTVNDAEEAKKSSMRFAQLYARNEIDLQRSIRLEQEAIRDEEERPAREAKEAAREKFDQDRDIARENLKEIRTQIKSLSGGGSLDMKNNAAKIEELRKLEDAELEKLGIGVVQEKPVAQTLTQEQFTALGEKLGKSEKEIEEGWAEYLKRTGASSQ